MRNAFKGSSVDRTEGRKESVSVKASQQELLKPKHKMKNE